MGFGAGMGLVNIKSCSDEMHLESTVGVGTHLTIIMYY
jgi:serine/threonine-protein kinase RsbT